MLNARFDKQIKLLSETHQEDIKIGELIMGIGVGYGKPLTSYGNMLPYRGLPIKRFTSKKLIKQQPFMFVK